MKSTPRLTHSPSVRRMPARCVAVLLAVLLATPDARAEPPPAAPPATTPAEPAAPAPPPPDSTASPGLDFDLFGDQPKPTLVEDAATKARADAMDRKVLTRRRMLTAHQAFGFATLGLLAATLVLGQLNFHDKFVNGDYTEKYNLAHRYLAIGSELLTPEKVDTTGEKPGWICHHRACYSEGSGIVLSGGKIRALVSGSEEYLDNRNSYVLDVPGMVWRCIAAPIA